MHIGKRVAHQNAEAAVAFPLTWCWAVSAVVQSACQLCVHVLIQLDSNSTSELPRQAAKTNPPRLHLHCLLACLLASLLVWMTSASRATVVVLALLILCLASGPAEAGLWRQQRYQPSFTTVPSRIAAKGQGKASLPSYALSPG